MSSPNQARRVTAQIFFQGADITGSMRPYLLSATYTDKEADETDDLQLKLQDRDDIWLQKWLADAIDGRSLRREPVRVPQGQDRERSKVLQGHSQKRLECPLRPQHQLRQIRHAGLRRRAAGRGYRKRLGEDQLQRQDRLCQRIVHQRIRRRGSSASAAAPASGAGFKISAVFVRENWTGGGRDKVLDCGQFELDSVDASGPPNTITIKATALPYSAQIRQTEKSKAWESYTLSGIANEMAAANGMTCMYLSNSDPFYGRVEQYKQSDIAFLSKLCHEAGISLKATNNLIVLFDRRTTRRKILY